MASTKVKVTLDIEYDMIPTKYNKVEIEKILAITCHLLQKDNLLSWSDIEVTSYRYNIDTNPYYRKFNNNNNYNKNRKATNQRKEKSWTHL